jgi:acyl-coenzyme A synthetase/AMP-(fatty) acid ligase
MQVQHQVLGVAWVGSAMNRNPLWDRFEVICAARARDTAIARGERSFSFTDLHAIALALAARLPAGPGERVLVMLDNEPRTPALLAAIWRIGARAVFLHASPPPSHLAHVLAQTRPALVVGDAGDVASGAMTIDALLDLPPQLRPAVPMPPGEIASITFTSGSTGTPKGVMECVANLLDGPARIGRLMRYAPGDVILNPVPLAFDYGLGQYLSLLCEGVPMVLPEERSGQGVLAAIARHRPTVLAGYPSLFAELALGLAPTRQTPRESLRLMTNTGSRIARPAFEALLDLFPQAEVSLNYGLTETYRTASLPPALARSHPDSVGFGIEGVEVLVLRPDGSRAAADEEGEIVHRGAGAFRGYWNDAERSARVLRPDPERGPGAPPVVFTGDLGRISGEGLLYFHGRRDRQIKVLGAIVSPEEVEALLAASGLVREAAVTSLAHDILGEVVVACVIPPADMALEGRSAWLNGLKRHCRATLGPYMQPRGFEVMEAFPRARSGKVGHAALRALVARGLAIGAPAAA